MPNDPNYHHYTPPEVVESEDFLNKVAHSMDYPEWDTLRMGLASPGLSFYGAIRPRNDGLRYLNLKGGYSVGMEVDEANYVVRYVEFL